MIERFDPFGRVMSLRQMMDRMLEDAFIMPWAGDAGAASTVPDLNVYEEGDNLVVEAQLPGVRPEDVEITVGGGTLTIRCQQRQEDERKERNYIIREVRQGAFARTLRLPDTIDPDRADAKLENGMLRLVFPRSEQARTRRISVTGAGRQGQLTGSQGMESQGAMSAGATTQQQTDRPGQPERAA